MSTQPSGSDVGGRPAGIDWRAAEQSPEFRKLVRTRNRFVYPATAFFLTWYVGFVLLAGYAPDFMGESVYEGLTVGYVLALSQFVMTWGLAWWYLRKSNREFDPLAEEARRVALAAAASKRPDGAAGTEVQR
jgi:uncharacterized membrane protein (DUF485 family)